MNINRMLFVSALALVGTFASPASAQEIVNSTIVVDAKDDLNPDEIKQLATDYHLDFTPTALEKETKEELAVVAPEQMVNLLQALSNDPRVEIAEPLYRVHALYTPNDPMYKDQWGMDNVRAKTAWNYSTGRGIVVAVIDTGVAFEDHNGFAKLSDYQTTNFVTGWNVIDKNNHPNDDNAHGSHCASTIAESTNNNLGGVGLAFNTQIMPVKVLDGDGSGTSADVADGIRWAANNGAQVISMSLGSDYPDKVEAKAINYARSKGVTVIAAAGNSGRSVGYPAAFDGVVAVSAIGPDDKITSFSSRGKEVDIAAPGLNILQQTICDGGKNKCEEYEAFSGTSMSTPHVAAAAALVESLGATNPDSVEAVLKKSARVVDSSENAKNLYGAGLLDAGAAVRSVVLNHALTRILALLSLTFLVSYWAKKKNKSATSPWSASFLVPAFFSGVGLFFLPFVIPCVALPLDLASRALPDMDLVMGLNVHKWLLGANALIPMVLMALLFGVKQLRPVVSGVAVGMAAYLASVVYLGDQLAPMGTMLQGIWCSANILGLAWVAKKNLAETK